MTAKFDALTDAQLISAPVYGNYAPLVIEYKKLKEHHVEETEQLAAKLAALRAEIAALKLATGGFLPTWRSAERAPFGGDEARTCNCINGCGREKCDGGL